VPGWDTINNALSGTVGQDVESRADFETRRYASVFKNALGPLQAIYAEVFAQDGVIDVYVTQNVTDGTVATGETDYDLLPHSLYVAVVGGYANDIANAIFNKMSAGCNTNGSEEVTVYDTSGYTIPYPEYTIRYEIPDALPIKFSVALAANALLPSDIVTRVKNTIISAFSGGDGGRRERIAQKVFASRYYSPVAQCCQGVEIIDILIGTSTATLYTVAVGIDQIPTVQASDITVTIT
jgi:hypothetical protein